MLKPHITCVISLLSGISIWHEKILKIIYFNFYQNKTGVRFAKVPKTPLVRNLFEAFFRAFFSGSTKRFSKRPFFPDIFRNLFEICDPSSCTSLTFSARNWFKIAIDTVALNWVCHVRNKLFFFSINRLQISDLPSSRNVYFLTLFTSMGYLV